MVEQSNRNIIPGYEVIRKIGQGGMGAVFLARQISLGRQVAIKLVASQYMNDPISLERFKREAKAAGMVNHKNLVSVYEFGEIKDHPYYVMEYVEGESLSNILELKKTLSEDEALRIIGEIAEALQHIHEKHLIHRDIKPGNILITKDGTAKLCDMGFVKQTMGEIATTITTTGEIFGSPAYISPEQLLSKKDIDIRSDIYSLGVSLFQMLTGEYPFKSDSLAELAAKRLHEDPMPPRKINPNIRQSTNNLILKMMARNPDDRYTTPANILNDLAKLKRGEYIKPPPLSTKKRIIFAATIVAVVAVLLTILFINKTNFDKAEAGKHYNKGLTFYDNHNYKEAIAEFDKAIELNPADYAFYNRRGSAKYYLGNYKSAIEDYDKAISLNQRFAELYVNRGAAKSKLGDLAGEIKDYGKAIEVDPDYVIAYNNKGTAKVGLGDYNGAIESYDKVIQLSPKNGEGYMNRGIAKYKLGNYDDAIADFDKSKMLNSKDARAYYYRGIAMCKQDKNLTTAINEFTKAIEINQNYADAYCERGVVEYDIRDYDGAIKDFGKAIELNADYAKAYNMRGAAKCVLGRYNDGIIDLDKAINIDPENADAYRDRSFAKGKLGDISGATEDINKALNLQPNSASYYLARGYLKYELKNYKDALDDFNKAISISPNFADAYLQRGIIKSTCGDNEEALSDLEKSVKLNSSLKEKVEPLIATIRAGTSTGVIKSIDEKAKDIEFLYNLAEKSRSMGKYAEAKIIYDKVINANPNYIQAYIGRGMANADFGKYNDAISDFTAAIQLDPQNKDAYVERGNVKFKIGTTQYLKEAIADWRKAEELDPLWKDWLENQINEALDKIVEK